jgi:ABC-2 type transport system ATP-binding protein
MSGRLAEQASSQPTPAIGRQETAPSSLPQTSPESQSPLLLFEQASKWYGPVLALNQVTLTLNGGITGLVGANGAGKSTIIKLATGQIRPTLGRVTVRGLDAFDWRTRRLVGYCPDHDAFYEDLSGRRFVLEMARLYGFPKAVAHERTEAVLKQVGMLDRADRVIRGYSKGMRQRVKLAQALLHDPELLILDEPLSGIDPLGRMEVLELFRTLAASGKCLLISSHELEELEKLTSHVAIMARGRIAAVGTLSQIRDLLDDRPFQVRIAVDRPRELAQHLIEMEVVLGLDLTPGGLVIRVRKSNLFFEQFGQIVIRHNYQVLEVEPLDDSAHAILGYLLGGSGKT